MLKAQRAHAVKSCAFKNKTKHLKKRDLYYF